MSAGELGRLDSGHNSSREGGKDVHKKRQRTTAFGSLFEGEIGDEVLVKDQAGTNGRMAAGSQGRGDGRQAGAGESAAPRVTQRMLLTSPATWTTGRSPPMTPRTMKTYSMPNAHADPPHVTPRQAQSMREPASARASSGLVRFVPRLAVGTGSNTGKPPLARRSLTGVNPAIPGSVPLLPPGGTADGADNSNHSTHDSSSAGQIATPTSARSPAPPGTALNQNKPVSTYTAWWRFLKGMISTSTEDAPDASTEAAEPATGTVAVDVHNDKGSSDPDKQGTAGIPVVQQTEVDDMVESTGLSPTVVPTGADGGSGAGIQLGSLHVLPEHASTPDSSTHPLSSASGQLSTPTASGSHSRPSSATPTGSVGRSRPGTAAAEVDRIVINSGEAGLQHLGSSGPGTALSSQTYSVASVSVQSESVTADIVPWDPTHSLLRPSTAPPATHAGAREAALVPQGSRTSRRSKFYHQSLSSHPSQSMGVSQSCPTTPSSAADMTTNRKKRTRSPLNTGPGLPGNAPLELSSSMSPQNSLPSASPPPADEGTWIPWSSTFSWLLKRPPSVPPTTSRSDQDLVFPGRATSPSPGSAMSSRDTVLTIHPTDSSKDGGHNPDTHTNGSNGQSRQEQTDFPTDAESAPSELAAGADSAAAGTTAFSWFVRRMGAAMGAPEASVGQNASGTNTSQTGSLPPLPTSPTPTVDATPSGHVSPSNSPQQPTTLHEPDEIEHPLSPQNTVRGHDEKGRESEVGGHHEEEGGSGIGGQSEQEWQSDLRQAEVTPQATLQSTLQSTPQSTPASTQERKAYTVPREQVSSIVLPPAPVTHHTMEASSIPSSAGTQAAQSSESSGLNVTLNASRESIYFEESRRAASLQFPPTLPDKRSPFAQLSSQPFSLSTDNTPQNVHDFTPHSMQDNTPHSMHDNTPHNIQPPSTAALNPSPPRQPALPRSQQAVASGRTEPVNTPAAASTPTGDSPSLASLCTGATFHHALSSVPADEAVNPAVLSSKSAVQTPPHTAGSHTSSDLTLPSLSLRPAVQQYKSPIATSDRSAVRPSRIHSRQGIKLITDPDSTDVSGESSSALLSTSAPSQLMRFSSSNFSHLGKMTQADLSKLSPAQLTHVLSHRHPVNKAFSRSYDSLPPSRQNPAQHNTGQYSKSVSDTGSGYSSAHVSGHSSGLGTSPAHLTHLDPRLIVPASPQEMGHQLQNPREAMLHTSPVTSPGVIYNMFPGFSGEVLPEVPPLTWQALAQSRSGRMMDMDAYIPPAPQPTPANTPTARGQNNPWLSS